jgi:hypothetical protein
MCKALSGIEEGGINAALVSPRGDCGWMKTTLTDGSGLSAGERGGWVPFQDAVVGPWAASGTGPERFISLFHFFFFRSVSFSVFHFFYNFFI